MKNLEHTRLAIKDMLELGQFKLIKTYQMIPVLVRAVLLSTLLWGVGGYLPTILFRGRYAGEIPDPFSATELVAILPYMPLATVPILTVWLWFPTEVVSFTRLFNSVSKAAHVYPIKTKRAWHVPASIGIVACSMVPFVYGLSSDAILEWFEIVGWWGWLFLVFMVGVQCVAVVLTLFRIAHFILWFRRMARQGLRLNPTDADGCGGLAFIGSTFGKLTAFAVVMGFFEIHLIVVSIFRNNRGLAVGEISLGLIVNAAVLLAAYMTLIVAFLVIPTFITHRAMVRERDELLSDVSTRFQEADKRIVSQRTLYSALPQEILAQYLVIKRNYPVLPFTTLQWRIVRLLSASPPFIGGMAAVLRSFGGFGAP